MASTADPSGELSDNSSRDVVKDFARLSLEGESYESILRHTENLRRKLLRKGCNVDVMVGEVIHPLISILNHSDQSHEAQLQQTALSALRTMADKAVETDVYGILVKAGVMPQLLKLLKLYPEVLASDIIYLISRIKDPERKVIIPSQGEYIESLLSAVKCTYTSPMVKSHALGLIRLAFSEEMPSPETTRIYLHELIMLLCDEDYWTVECTCSIFTEMFTKGSEDVINAMLSSGCLTHFIGVLHRVPRNKFLNTAAAEVLQCLIILASRSQQYAEQMLQKGIMSLLEPFKNWKQIEDDLSNVNKYILAHSLSRAISQWEQ